MRLLALIPAILAFATSSAAAAPQIAVTRVHCAPCWRGIALVDSTGAGLTALTGRAGQNDSDPAWSPDGKQLAFTRSTNGGRSFQVYVMNAAGRARHRLTRGRFDERPAWSPNGRWIAYQAIGGVIRLVHPNGTGDHAVLGTRGSSGPAWSPDGIRLAFAQGAYIVTARADGSGRKRIVRGREPSWSPDGHTIAYTGPNGGVFVVAGAGGRGGMLHSGLEPDWSPDGTQIAFARWSASGVFSVWVMNADGQAARRVLANALSPDWR